MIRRFVVFTLAVAAFGPYFALQAMPRSDEKACEVAARWVQENRHALPHTLDGVAALPPVYKRLVFNALTPEQKSILWREHLRRFLEQEKLTEEQRAFVRMAIDFATPQLYRDAAIGRTVKAQAEHQAHHKAIREQAVALFSVQMRRVFADLGYTTVTPSGTLPMSVKRVSFDSAGDAFEAQCECEVGDNWCSWERCSTPPDGCQTTETGCGFLNCGPCNGTCGGDIENIR